MTTLVTPRTRPSHTPSVSGMSLSPECPQVWTKDVGNIGDNSPRRVRFERSAYLSPSVDHLWTDCGEPHVGRSGSVDEIARTGDGQPALFSYSQTAGRHPRPTHSQSPTKQPESTRNFPVVHRIHTPDDDDYLFSSVNNYTTFTDAPVDISPSLRQSPIVVGVFGRTHR